LVSWLSGDGQHGAKAIIGSFTANPLMGQL